MKKIGILGFTDRGIGLGKRLVSSLPEYSWESFTERKNSREVLKKWFAEKDTIVFVGATGICIRLIAPLIKSKDTDPAVVVIDELGRFTIPVLSGHLGGANEAGETISKAIGSTLVLTTATDVNGIWAVDNWTKKAGLRIKDISKIKEISSRLLKGEKIGLISDFEVVGNLPNNVVHITREEDARGFEAGICVSLNHGKEPFKHTLNALPQIYSLGIGCKKDFPSSRLEEFIVESLRVNDIPLYAIGLIGSINLKKDEKAIRDFARKYGKDLVFFDAKELAKVPGQFTSSKLVKEVTGVDNVCERSAMAIANLGKDNKNKRLLIKKTSGGGCTLAVATWDWKCRF